MKTWGNVCILKVKKPQYLNHFMPKILQWPSTLPKPLVNCSSLPSHSAPQYTYRRSPVVSVQGVGFWKVGELSWVVSTPCVPTLPGYPHPTHPHIHSCSNSFDSYAQLMRRNSNLKYKKETALTNVYWVNSSTEEGTWPSTATPQDLIFIASL